MAIYKDVTSDVTYTKPITTPTNIPAPTDPIADYWKSVAAGQFTVGDLSKYMSSAGNILGGLDLSGFQQTKDAIQQGYDINKDSLNQSFQNLLNDLAASRTESAQQFGEARGTIMEDAFTRNRDLYRNLAARGLGASGLQQLGTVQNRMETGKQVSNVAGQYYDAMQEIAKTESRGQESYATQQKTLSNELNQNLASLNQQEISYTSAYQQSLANLAMQLQSSAQAALGVQSEAAYNLAALEDSRNSEAEKIRIASNKSRELGIREWMDVFKVDYNTASSQFDKYSGQLETGLKTEVFTGYKDQLSNLEGFNDMAGMMTKLKSEYDSGSVDATDIDSFIKQNWGTFGDVNNWKREGLIGGTLDFFLDDTMDLLGSTNRATIESAIRFKNVPDSEIRAMILDFYGIE